MSTYILLIFVINNLKIVLIVKNILGLIGSATSAKTFGSVTASSKGSSSGIDAWE